MKEYTRAMAYNPAKEVKAKASKIGRESNRKA